MTRTAGLATAVSGHTSLLKPRTLALETLSARLRGVRRLTAQPTSLQETAARDTYHLMREYRTARVPLPTSGRGRCRAVSIVFVSNRMRVLGKEEPDTNRNLNLPLRPLLFTEPSSETVSTTILMTDGVLSTSSTPREPEFRHPGLARADSGDEAAQIHAILDMYRPPSSVGLLPPDGTQRFIE